MKSFLKYLGIIILLCGVVCLVVYAFVPPVAVAHTLDNGAIEYGFNYNANALLGCGLAIEFLGIITHVVCNKFID